MQPLRPKQIEIELDDVHDLFAEHDFDPFADDVGTIPSIARLAQLPQVVSQLRTARLCVLLPARSVTPQTEAQVQRAYQRYCAHSIAEARRKLAAMRWVGLRTFLLGLVLFGVSLAASTSVGRLLFIPEALRTVIGESLIVAGWVVIWQPLDTLVQGWWPQWEEERTFRALSAVPLQVRPVNHP
jgi:hypothetical protein